MKAEVDVDDKVFLRRARQLCDAAEPHMAVSDAIDELPPCLGHVDEARRQLESGPTGGGGEPTAASGSAASIVARAPSSSRGPGTSEEE